MKRIATLVFISAAFVVPGTAAFASPPAQPQGFECNAVDQLGNVPAPIADGVFHCSDNDNVK